MKNRFVAEVWLDWGIGRGSTMYRSTAKSQRLAALKAKVATLLLDLLLPKFFWGPSRAGRPVRYSHDFCIRYGVRQATALEQKDGVTAIWTCSMPGSPGFSGESAAAHPWTKDANATLDASANV
jgi:hypothetical protein